MRVVLRATGSSYIPHPVNGVRRLQALGIAMWVIMFVVITAVTVPKAIRWHGERVESEARRMVMEQRLAQAAVQTGPDSELRNALVAWVTDVAKVRLSPQFAGMIVDTVFREAVNRRVDPFLMLALIRVESEFDYTARSPAGALGLTQVIVSWHPEKLTTVTAFDPKANIAAGTTVLAEYMQRHRSLSDALLRYNGSLGADTGYSKAVLSARQQLLADVQRRLG